MPIRLHLFLLFTTKIAALIGGFLLGMNLHEAIQASLPDILNEKIVRFFMFGLLPALLALILTDLLFLYAIPARCPKCGGRARYRGSQTRKNRFGARQKIPITYHCQGCGHTHRTNINPASPLLPD